MSPETTARWRRNIWRMLRRLQTEPAFAGFRDRIRVFGSVGAGDPEPCDLDIIVDFRDFRGSTLTPASADPRLYALLTLSRIHNGSLDVFVLVDDVLWVRNDRSTDFIMAKYARQMAAAGRRGRPLAEIVDEWLPMFTPSLSLKPEPAPMPESTKPKPKPAPEAEPTPKS